MPGRLSPWLINGCIDTILRSEFVGGPAVFGNDWYLSLLVESPDPYMGPFDQFFIYPRATEVVYTGYARQRANQLNTSWRRTDGDNGTAASSGTTGETSVGNRLYYPLCTTSTQVITHVGLMGSNIIDPDFNYCYGYFTLQFPIQLQNAAPGFYPVIAQDALKVKFA